ncbi:cuticle protein-like [Lucilia sericata]|uniref:cuticle protein-like n=1 Tax=Lucilia sericata TaxID=13632 RepID=UPI0018A80AF6|nr:cuticle protein-like [Lucilia sericata]
MAFKFIAFLAFVTVVSAGLVPVPQVYHPAAVTYAHPQPVLAKHHDDQYDPHPQYKFAYEINDKHTGDNHSQQEERNGDLVHGEYSLIDADGFRRIVQYSHSFG